MLFWEIFEANDQKSDCETRQLGVVSAGSLPFFGIRFLRPDSNGHLVFVFFVFLGKAFFLFLKKEKSASRMFVFVFVSLAKIRRDFLVVGRS